MASDLLINIGSGNGLLLELSLNLSHPGQNGRHFADDTFKRIFVNENARISIKIQLKLVLKAPIENKAALVRVMAWRRTGDKPLSEQMLNQQWRMYVALGREELRDPLATLYHPADSLRNDDVIITSKRRHFVKMGSFQRENDVIITSCVLWAFV